MGIRSEQKDERHKQILEVALELFVQKGYSATKITDIAKAARMSTGLLFHYFDSKEKLYEELVRIGSEGMQYPQKMDATSPDEFFLGFTKALFTYSKAEPWVARMFVFMETARRSDVIPESMKALACRIDQIALSAEVIRMGQEKGIFREGDPQALSFAFWSSIQGIMEQLVLFPDNPLPEAEWIVDIIRK